MNYDDEILTESKIIKSIRRLTGAMSERWSWGDSAAYWREEVDKIGCEADKMTGEYRQFLESYQRLLKFCAEAMERAGRAEEP